MILIDTLVNTSREVEPGKWAIAKPITAPLMTRVKDAWCVLAGRCEAVSFVEDSLDKDARYD